MPGSSTSPRAKTGTSRGETTLAPSRFDAAGGKPVGAIRLPTLTLLWHPDIKRIGERALLAAPNDGVVELGRTTPTFTGVDGTAVLARPIEDRHLSRQSLHLVVGAPDGSITIRRAGSSTPVEIDGEPLDQDRLLSIDTIERGVTLVLGRSVTALLHLDAASADGEPVDGMIGASSAMRRLRQEIRIAARLDVPVLLRGESGTGKELVARAIHETSRRADQPYLAVNLAAVPAALAASELFGVAKGAFTGA
ncbi:MAG: sigma 54-interacting transcriptional regulator, partial [Acidobacteriota bacterium]